jgi:HEAT repeats
MSNHLEKFISNNKDAFDTALPSNDVLKKLQQNIAMLEEKQIKKQTLFRFVQYVAAACLIAIMGIGLYVYNQPNKSTVAKSLMPQKQNVKAATSSNITLVQNDRSTKIIPSTGLSVSAKNTETVAIATKYKYMNQLQNMEVASKRYNAAIAIVQTKKIDKEIIKALTHCLNTDPNTNVRLAALESLSKFYKEPMVKKQLIESLQQQKDPIIKMSLIDVLTKIRANNLMETLEKIATDVNTPKLVKDQAYQSIHTLSL